MDKKYKLRKEDMVTLQKKKVMSVSTLTLQKSSLKHFINQNKQKIYDTARNNTKYNENGQPTISRNDDWFNEDVWDEHFKKVNNKK